MVAIAFSKQKGTQRQKSLKAWHGLLLRIGNDVEGIMKHSRKGKALHKSFPSQDARATSLVVELGKRIQGKDKQTTHFRKLILSIAKQSGFKCFELEKEFQWKVPRGQWNRILPEPQTSSTPSDCLEGSKVIEFFLTIFRSSLFICSIS